MSNNFHHDFLGSEAEARTMFAPRGPEHIRTAEDPPAPAVRHLSEAAAAAWQRIVAGYQRAMSDQESMPLARVKKAGALVKSELEALAKAAERVLELARQTREQADRARELRPADPVVAAEVRRYVATLHLDQRSELVERALAAGDRDTLAALFGVAVPSYLAAMTDAEHASLRRRALEKLFPEASRARAVADWSGAEVRRIANTFARSAGRLLPHEVAAAPSDDLAAADRAAALAEAEVAKLRDDGRVN